MYAVFQTGGKQYRVFEGQILFVEILDMSIGMKVEFDKVLLIKRDNYIKIGNPFIKSGKVIAEIISYSLCKKVKIIKFHRRKHSCKCQGHRQRLMKIKIISIDVIL